ncbi:hypothetical protein [Streptomyces sp. NPDC055607]
MYPHPPEAEWSRPRPAVRNARRAREGRLLGARSHRGAEAGRQRRADEEDTADEVLVGRHT